MNNGKHEFTSKVIDILRGISTRKGLNINIDQDTQVFETKILDSMTFVEFITALETDLNVNVPDHKMSTQYFLTPACIALNFGV